MKTISAGLVLAAAAWLSPAWGSPGNDVTQELLALERKAMDGWLKGNPDPHLAILDPTVTFLHEVTGKRVEGIAAVAEIYGQYRGVPLFDSYEILDPKVQAVGDVAVLTYVLVQHNGDVIRNWNGTQVYWRKKEGWRLIHSHWSAAKTPQP